MLKVVQLVQTLAPGQILIVQYMECHVPVTGVQSQIARGFQNWFYRLYMTYRLFLSSHLWLEFAHTPESYRDTGRAKLGCDVEWLPRGWAVWNHPNHSTLSLHVYLLSISMNYRQVHCFMGSWDNLFDHSGILTEANSFQLHIGAPGSSRR